ncbi:hypothetical protein Salat_1188400 [Sesamum alatum]|uniref:Uncharacterized protein n=1 Tax=Sesamum alatum TaxID=300844 RepID=A0AAE2CNN9_9LAMI|nr:hypothetical protein Salat_1188400 [Sesamum alatum]
MVGAPVSFSGNQPQPPAATNDTTAKYAPPPQMYATPSASISTLLPYDGQQPPPPPCPTPAGPYLATTSAPFPTNVPVSSAPLNTNYLYPPNQTSPFPQNPPTSTPYPVGSAAPPTPFPPCSTAPPPPFPPYSTTPANTYPPSLTNTPTATYPPTSSAPSPFPGAYPPNSGLNQAPASLTGQPPSPYPPAGYPPQPNNPLAPSGYPTGQPTGNYTQPASTYPQANPTNQAPPYSTGAYPAPPPASGIYPTPPPTGGNGPGPGLARCVRRLIDEDNIFSDLGSGLKVGDGPSFLQEHTSPSKGLTQVGSSKHVRYSDVVGRATSSLGLLDGARSVSGFSDQRPTFAHLFPTHSPGTFSDLVHPLLDSSPSSPSCVPSPQPSTVVPEDVRALDGGSVSSGRIVLFEERVGRGAIVGELLPVFDVAEEILVVLAR